MRIFSVVGSLAVLACVLVVSYSHTYALMVSVGFHGVFGHFAVIAFEALFLVSVTNIVFAKTKGVAPGVPLYAGFFLGLSVVFWGNVRAGLDYGLTGAIIGGLIPVTLVVGESILAFSLIVSRRRATQVADQEDGQKETTSQVAEDAQVGATQVADQEDGQKEVTAQVDDAGQADTQRVPKLEEEERARRLALQLKEELGRWPGRPKLMAKGVRESVARRVLAELKTAEN